MTSVKFLIGSLLSIAFTISLAVAGQAADDAKLTDEHLKLRNETAINYSQPESHLKLARYHYDLGNKVQAFYIAEFTRHMFGDKAFTPAFEKVAAIKLEEPQSFTNEEELTEYCRAHPESFESYMRDLEPKLKAATPGTPYVDQMMDAALAKFPQHYAIKAIAAKYYLKIKKDEEKALPLYIDLYFHDPHFYDWEYAEFRIKQIVSSRKASWWETRKKSGAPLQQLVSAETNPRLLDVVIAQARETWDASLVPVMLAMLDNDDVLVQTGALHTLLAHPSDLTKAQEIRAMLTADDLVKRGMASFLVVKCLGPSEYPLLQDNLDSGVELIQIDTMHALSQMGGGKGLEYLKAHPPAKATERMKDLWRQKVSEGKNTGEPSAAPNADPTTRAGNSDR